jgi:DNA-binding transcriptional MerR regulator
MTLTPTLLQYVKKYFPLRRYSLYANRVCLPLYHSGDKDMSDYYRIKEFGKLTSTTIKTLHYYDKIGLLKPRKNTTTRYRLYVEHDILRLQQIMLLKFLGYPLREIKRILSTASTDIKTSLKTQAKLLAKKSEVSKDAAWFIEQIIAQLEQSNTLNWQMAAKIIVLLQLDEDNKLKWQKYYYTKSEYDELAQMTLKYSAAFWQDYNIRWEVLFKEVGNCLATDPEGDLGMYLAKKWLDLRNEVQFSPALQKKGWEAFQKGLVPQEIFAYDPRVIEYITKATLKYKHDQNRASMPEEHKVSVVE